MLLPPPHPTPLTLLRHLPLPSPRRLLRQAIPPLPHGAPQLPRRNQQAPGTLIRIRTIDLWNLQLGNDGAGAREQCWRMGDESEEGGEVLRGGALAAGADVLVEEIGAEGAKGEHGVDAGAWFGVGGGVEGVGG